MEKRFIALSETFTRELLRYNQTHNITGAKSEASVYEHIVDSIYPITFLNRYTTIYDIGTGAGFPGMVLAFQLDANIYLIEPDKKRAAFLLYIKSLLGLEHVHVLNQKVETIHNHKAQLITSRAVTKTKELLALCSNLIQEGTDLLFYKGSRVNEELDPTMDFTLIERGANRNYLFIKG
jgi:16S rRNA (guanine527-N7)-methyltransferase